MSFSRSSLSFTLLSSCCCIFGLSSIALTLNLLLLFLMRLILYRIGECATVPVLMMGLVQARRGATSRMHRRDPVLRVELHPPQGDHDHITAQPTTPCVGSCNCLCPTVSPCQLLPLYLPLPPCPANPASLPPPCPPAPFPRPYMPLLPLPLSLSLPLPLCLPASATAPGTAPAPVPLSAPVPVANRGSIRSHDARPAPPPAGWSLLSCRGTAASPATPSGRRAGARAGGRGGGGHFGSERGGGAFL